MCTNGQHHEHTDFGTGVYHWSVDNYGDGNTPIVGDQIAAFQGHHQRPWTITEREFCNNVHKVCCWWCHQVGSITHQVVSSNFELHPPSFPFFQVFKPALPFSALFLLLTPWTPAPLQVSMALFIWLVCMSQQFHAWSHMKASELHPIVLAMQVLIWGGAGVTVGMWQQECWCRNVAARFLCAHNQYNQHTTSMQPPPTTTQDAGLLISRRAHGAHHKAPFEGNYCIVSGVWNDFLDDGGSDKGFFRQLERVVYNVTGVEPRCWSEPNYELFDGYYKDGSNIAS